MKFWQQGLSEPQFNGDSSCTILTGNATVCIRPSDETNKGCQLNTSWIRNLFQNYLKR